MRSGRDRWLRRQLDFLGSGRLTVVLLPVILVILYVHLVIPQQGQVEERVLLSWVEQRGAWGRGFRAMGLTDILHSWPFWSVYGLLFLNLSVCMTRRLPMVLRLCRFPDRPPRPAPGWLHREIEVAGLGPERVAERLRKQGYRTLVAEQTVYGLRGRLAGVGHWVFHAGLLALLVAGARLRRHGTLSAAPSRRARARPSTLTRCASSRPTRRSIRSFRRCGSAWSASTCSWRTGC